MYNRQIYDTREYFKPKEIYKFKRDAQFWQLK